MNKQKRVDIRVRPSFITILNEASCISVGKSTSL